MYFLAHFSSIILYLSILSRCKNVIFIFNRRYFVFQTSGANFSQDLLDFPNTVWKLQDYSITQILREIIVGELRVSKLCHFNTFRGSEFWLWIFALFEDWKIPIKQNLEPLKLQKQQIWNLYILQNWFHVKSM